jgi:hypothetical protein
MVSIIRLDHSLFRGCRGDDDSTIATPYPLLDNSACLNATESGGAITPFQQEISDTQGIV